MSPQHVSFHNTFVVLREICGREFERIINTVFMNLSHMSCECITDVKNSCESVTDVKESNVSVTNTFEFFTLVTDSFYFHIRTNLSHV